MRVISLSQSYFREKGSATIAPLTLLLGITLAVEPLVMPPRAPATNGTSALPAGVQGTGPTGRGRLVVIAPTDPLVDPAWRLRERHLRIATKTSVGLLSASIASLVMWVSIAGGTNDDPGPRIGPAPVFPWIAIGVGATSLLATTLVGAAYDSHLRSATRHAAPLPDLRSQPAWATRERTLSRRLYYSAALTGVGLSTGPLLFAQNDESQTPGLIVTSIGLGALLSLSIVPLQLRHHRRKLVRWPRRGAGPRR